MWNATITTLTTALRLLFGDRAAGEAAAADDQAALRAQFAAEFSGPERSGRWNSFVDGLNRLPRPLFTFGTLGLFIWAVCDPLGFTVAMSGLQAIPEPLWVGMGTIVFFWFGGRAVEGFRAPNASTKALKELAREIDGMKKIVTAPEPAGEERYRREMADGSRPLSDGAIAEWNRRRDEAAARSDQGGYGKKVQPEMDN